jgi:hypothetical protein
MAQLRTVAKKLQQVQKNYKFTGYNNSKQNDFLFSYLNTNSTVMTKHTISFFYLCLFCLLLL